METYQTWSLVVSAIVGASITAQAFFAGILIRYTKRQKTINVRQTLVAELALNFNVIVEKVRTMDKKEAVKNSAQKTALMKKMMDDIIRIEARNAKIREELDQLPIT